jgi:hypothetical protein
MCINTRTTTLVEGTHEHEQKYKHKDAFTRSLADEQTDSQLLATIHALGKLPQTPGKKLPRLVAMVT